MKGGTMTINGAKIFNQGVLIDPSVGKGKFDSRGHISTRCFSITGLGSYAKKSTERLFKNLETRRSSNQKFKRSFFFSTGRLNKGEGFMENLIKLENYKNSKNEAPKIIDANHDGYVENNLKPVTVTGTIVPWTEEIKYGHFSDHKLVMPHGREYFFISNTYWKTVLAYHVWDEVKVKGLFNPTNGVLIPQLIYPKGPFVQNENPIGFATSRVKKIVKKIGKHLNELVIVPAGLLVMFMAL